MNQLDAANAATQLAEQAEAVAIAVAAAEWIAVAALAAAELAVSVSVSAAEPNKTPDVVLQAAKKMAAETLLAAKKVAAEKLIVAKEEAYKTLALAKEMAKSVALELLLQKQALNSISQGVLVTDAQRHTTYMNNAFEVITGYAKAEMMGGSCAILQGAETNPETVNALRAALNAGQSFHGEILNYRKNGTTFWNELSITPVRDDEGKLSQFVGIQRDVSERKISTEKIEHLAFYDHLTDLPNRRLLMDRLNHAFTTSQRSGQEGAVMFIDLDNFKDVNDTLGHNIGDLLIQLIAKRLESCMRAGDTIARLGGDEFVIVLESLSKQRIEAAKQVSAVGGKILTLLNQPYQLETHEYRGTCSIGVVLFCDHEQSADDLLKRADIALFRSKNAGRNTLTFFNDEMQSAINERVTIEKEINTALEKRQFLLYYQIQVDSMHRTLGAEALIRWLHPSRGLLSPDKFIPLTEEIGLILPIGQWVLEAACAQLKAWEQGLLTRDLVLSVNISAKEFRQANFGAQLKALVLSHSINPRLLKLELTESVLLESVEEAVALINTLKEIGLTFSLDDFGTGYSSLQYLKRLPIDQLKIDQSFVRNIVTDNSDRVIVHTIVAVAQSLGIGVIAEGVETKEQRQLLLENGCTQYQGYLFGKPMPIDQFEELLKRV
ncbi:EAL domain-containing protein [Zwartia sp.]|uniref:putative bifunctional diguanylate cyclase/phosphodiesterase n=1 Tax=Zwartia sp. TaxID=2978004 RepID=UPI00271FD749|nr:EAL domain-containing protein [Zwartia sp.]MDO9024271.1 EAL domain-containing protein [Zwartia sp.]